MTQAPQLDLTGFINQTETGFRLHRMELYNWGTFHDAVWQIEPRGNNSLLTGDIGSGKSTIVDALTTLLVPARKITYNKAAGAETRERSLNSYVRGAYKSEKSEITQSSRAVTLRNESSFTVLLAWFYNADFDQGMTIAQVFWLKEGVSNPERFYVTAETPLTIQAHFSEFGSDIRGLKKKLKKIEKLKISTSFREYSTRFRRFFGIASDQALDLFYQTVSMKSVGNLTDFVRHHMLEKTDIEGQLDELLLGFDNLNRLHEAVLKARSQIEKLTPICENLERHHELELSIVALREAREALSSWFARFQIELLQTRIDTLQKQSEQLQHRLKKLAQTIESLRDKENDIRHHIDNKGGRRLRQIEREIKDFNVGIDRCKYHYAAYEVACQTLELDSILDEDRFYDNQNQLEVLDAQISQAEDALQKERDHSAIQLSLEQDQHKQLSAEIESLRSRKSNIPRKSLNIRQGLLETLQLDENDLPFAGELIQVDENEADWEGSLERVLHNFGLSLLVPDRLYKRVSQYVDQTRLKGRLVYYRVTDRKQATVTSQPGTLVDKLHIKLESEFYEWLEQELTRRFNFHCSETLQDFRLHPYAISKNGQIKRGGKRHEKDDRYDLHDRSRFILGWSNREKLKVLEQQLKNLERQIQQYATAISSVEQQQLVSRKQADAVRDLKKASQFNEIDWQSLVVSVENLAKESADIESSSDVLQQLQQQLQQTQEDLRQKQGAEKELLSNRGTLKEKLNSAKHDLEDAEALAGEYPDERIAQHQALLQQWREEQTGNTEYNLRNLDKNQRQILKAMSARIGNDTASRDRLIGRIIQQMQKYIDLYPSDSDEVDARIEAGQEFQSMLDTLQGEDLPRHEAKFKQMLNEQTIQGVVMFQSQLEKERRNIEEKIGIINNSLQQIEYNSGTYISLLANPIQDADVRDFRAELKQILSNTSDNDDLYTEARFLQVKAIMEKFRGREGQTDQDRRWMKKVTDVRNWHSFSVSERWRESDEEKEFYSDSAGKSGGQKEKLAYTILASALAYQFGLAKGDSSSRSFHFVVIDEAFGRGSDESTRYALELFAKLRLQLLIVTPLQKIHIIEDYINGVHFVHNREGKYSMLRNLTIQEYQEEKNKF